MIVIFDIDNTLADCRHRMHHITGLTKDWDAFYKDVDKDPVIEPILRLYQSLTALADHTPIFITGRSEAYRVKTARWLENNVVDVLHKQQLLMRKDGDYRPDHVIKWELFQSLDVPVTDVLFAVEDRSRVVQMWRENRIPCLQVADGDY